MVCFGQIEKIGCIKKIIKNQKINLKIFFWPRYGEIVVYFHINQYQII